MGGFIPSGVFVFRRSARKDDAWRVALGPNQGFNNLGGAMGAGCHGPVSCAKQHPTYKSKYNPVKIAGNYCSISLGVDCTIQLVSILCCYLDLLPTRLPRLPRNMTFLVLDLPFGWSSHSSRTPWENLLGARCRPNCPKKKRKDYS